MKARLKDYRTVIIAGICLLILVLAIMSYDLFVQLRNLSTAKDDNTQWSISQLDIEFANLQVALAEPPTQQGYDDQHINLRFDIAMSRWSILTSKRSTAFFGSNEEAKNLTTSISEFANEASLIVDQSGPLTEERIRQLKLLIKTVRPEVRKVALLGVEIDAKRSEAQRAAFSKQFRQTGMTTIVLVILMSALMVLLNRLLIRAADRDAELLTSSELLQSTIAASLDAIVTANDKGEIIEYNAAAEGVFGWTRAQIIGKTMEGTFIPHRMRDAHHSGMDRYLKTGVPRVVGGGRVELVALRKTGEEFPVELNITAVTDSRGTKFIAYIRDISERKIAENDLIAARDRAEKTDRAKSHFLTIMSHEMRTPLNGILGVLDLLKTTDLTHDQDRYANIATASGEILLEHINEALDLTRIETGTLTLTPQVFDLKDLTEAVVMVLEPLAAEKSLSLTAHIDETLHLEFEADHIRIRQVLTNLIGNAIKFTDTGQIRLDVTGIHGPDASHIKFAVQDSGAGISADDQERVFEDFVALSLGKGRQTRGDGLGLSISRKIARQMGGDVTVDSTLHNGATFTLTLPLQRHLSGSSPSQTIQLDRHSKVRSCNALIVEDNRINRNVLRDMLERLGHTVTEAEDGAVCLERASERKFDIIFMDVSMPVMDGLDATRALRAGSGPNAQTHIVGLTAHGSEEFQEDAERSGMDNFQTKPIRLVPLMRILSNMAAAQFTHVAPLQSSSPLNEIYGLLGAEKLQDLSDRLFIEIEAFRVSLNAGTLQNEASDLAKTSHDLKGAAAQLEQLALAEFFEKIETLARSHRTPDIRACNEELAALLQQAHQSFATVLSTPSS
jgi:PAS domain S-box-containing protein